MGETLTGAAKQVPTPFVNGVALQRTTVTLLEFVYVNSMDPVAEVKVADPAKFLTVAVREVCSATVILAGAVNETEVGVRVFEKV